MIITINTEKGHIAPHYAPFSGTKLTRKYTVEIVLNLLLNLITKDVLRHRSLKRERSGALHDL